MAPALIGNHREGPCPRCGYPVRVGYPAAGGSPAEHFDARRLPELRLGKRDHVLARRRPRPHRRPRCSWTRTSSTSAARGAGRWPSSAARTRPEGVRQALRQARRRPAGRDHHRDRRRRLRQRRTAPQGARRGPRDARDRSSTWPTCPARRVGRAGSSSRLDDPPADETAVAEPATSVFATAHARRHRATSVGLTYRHWNLDDRKEEPVGDVEQLRRRAAVASPTGPPAHDFSVECDVEVAAAAGEASFACRLFDGADAVNAEIAVGPRARGPGHAEPRRAAASVRTIGRRASNRAGRYRVEFAFVDRRVTLAIDGNVLVAAGRPARRWRLAARSAGRCSSVPAGAGSSSAT